MNRNVKEWYLVTYNDNAGNDIADISFKWLYEYMIIGGNINKLGILDSIVRERIFTEMTELFDKDYDFFYNLYFKG